MEVERDVEIQIVEGEEDPKGNFKAGFSSGPHATRQLPVYSEDERRRKLGSPVVNRIRSIFTPGGHPEHRGIPDAGTTLPPIVSGPIRNGW